MPPATLRLYVCLSMFVSMFIFACQLFSFARPSTPIEASEIEIGQTPWPDRLAEAVNTEYYIEEGRLSYKKVASP